MTIADQERPPLRFLAGADAIALAERSVDELKKQIDAYRDLSTSLALDTPDTVSHLGNPLRCCGQSAAPQHMGDSVDALLLRIICAGQGVAR